MDQNTQQAFDDLQAALGRLRAAVEARQDQDRKEVGQRVRRQKISHQIPQRREFSDKAVRRPYLDPFTKKWIVILTKSDGVTDRPHHLPFDTCTQAQGFYSVALKRIRSTP
jgi:hypothetical protein